jgi:superfamily I DNA/RNA helicase
MPFRGFEGPAGTGKTFQLVEDIRARVGELAPAPHQRILALTFMHGSRRRLDERFAQPIETRNRATALTIDSFAAHVLRRWHGGVGPLPAFNDFDEVCDACGALLERPEIARWVGATFPIVAVDEAQELKPCRLRIVKALANRSEVVVAADEFSASMRPLTQPPSLSGLQPGRFHVLKGSDVPRSRGSSTLGAP